MAAGNQQLFIVTCHQDGHVCAAMPLGRCANEPLVTASLDPPATWRTGDLLPLQHNMQDSKTHHHEISDEWQNSSGVAPVQRLIPFVQGDGGSLFLIHGRKIWGGKGWAKKWM